MEISMAEEIKKEMPDFDESVFMTLHDIDVSDWTKEKNSFNYLPWASAWAEVKKRYPDATYHLYEKTMDDYGNTRPWFDDGKTGWVKTSVTICGITHTEILAIMDFKNKSMSAENITSADANKAYKRCLVKNLAMHGLGLYVYMGEDLPEELTKLIKLQLDTQKVAGLKAKAFGEKTIREFVDVALTENHPNVSKEEIAGMLITDIDNVEILESLKTKLLGLRKKTDK